MAQTVTFEMYVRSQNAWQSYDKFIELERDDALATAKSMDKEPGVEGVRIIRVTSFGSSRAPLETLEWISPALRRAAAKPGTATRRSTPSSDATDPQKQATSEAARERLQKKAANTSLDGKPTTKPQARTLKTGAIITGALLLSAALFVPTARVLERLVFTDASAPSLYQQAATFSVCALVFFVLAGIGFYFFISAEPAPSAPGKRVLRSSRPPPSSPAQAAAIAEPQRADPPPVEAPAPPLPFAPEPQAFDETEDSRAAEMEKDQPTPVPSSLSEDDRMLMLRFLEGSLSALADILKTVDKSSLFGINLFLGGAGDRYGTVNGLNSIQRFILIRETISALGTEADMIDVFCEKFDAYDRDPNYRFMTEAGRTIIDKYLAGEPDCFRTLPDLIKRWRRSGSATAQAQGIIVIMFTDLVGSTQMTHDHGDLGAQEVVRAHNAIVRNALAHYHGEEVKHTGDGIMASFANGPNAVRAAIAIQRDIDAHNRANPNLPVRVRLGLNAGDAVREENDFFGQTVQLAARICDKASENEIFITPSVHDLCRSHTFAFTEAGSYALKGIDEPVTAYAVGWLAEPPSETQTDN